MRLPLIILLLSVCVVNGFIGDVWKKIKDFFTSGDDLKERFDEVLNLTGIFYLYKQIKHLSHIAMKVLILPPAVLKSLIQRLTKLRPIEPDEVEDGGSIIDTNEKEGVSEFLYQGDMVLSESQAREIVRDIEEQVNGGNRTKRQAYRDRLYPSTIWSNGVKYHIDQRASNRMRNAFLKAVEIWSSNTCIDFTEIKNHGRTGDMVYVFPGEGCWSYVGRQGGRQSLSLGRGCEAVGVAVHELGHTLGFFHTMSRYDRDSYITINARNIKEAWISQFVKESKRTNYNYGLGYDCGSIMHYGMHAASRNDGPTMVPFDLNYQETLGSQIISFTDISMMNEHYKCKEKCKSVKSANCENGGFPHPRECSKCICPSGYGGRLCSERPSGCGEILQAKSNWTTLKDTIGYGTKLRPDFIMCNYWIQSASNTRIEVKILSFTRGVANDGCIVAGVEIKTNKNQTLTGYRFCAKEDAGVTLTSYSNLVPIITYNRGPPTTTLLQYRIYSEHQPKSTSQPKASQRTTRPTATTRTFTTTRPSTTTRTKTCVDRPGCDLYAYTTFCSFSTVRKICPKSCKVCS